MRTDAYTKPLDVARVNGEVAITGPEGVVISLSREAAITSAKRLLRAAGEDEPKEIYQKPLG